MRPYAQWLINHNLRYVLFLLLPVQIVIGVISFIPELAVEVYSEIRSACRAILTQPKD